MTEPQVDCPVIPTVAREKTSPNCYCFLFPSFETPGLNEALGRSPNLYPPYTTEELQQLTEKTVEEFIKETNDDVMEEN